MHTRAIEFFWDEAKRESNLQGFLDYMVVLVVHIESDDLIRIISMRRADKDEADLFFEHYGI